MSQSLLLSDEAARPTTRRRALVVEDDASIRSFVIAVLRRENFEVDAASNGREALALLADRSYGVIVLDLTMPEMNGLQLLEYLRHRDAELLRRVVVITATTSQRRPELPVELCHVLTKPFDLAAFHAVIGACTAES